LIPLNDNPRRPINSLALVTLSLIVINVLVFLYEVSLGASVDVFIRTYGAVPHEILTGQDVPPPGPSPLWIQLITSQFIHGGWLHLIGNMAYLRVFGDDIEDALGSTRYLLFYLAAGVAASLTQIFLGQRGDTTPSVGASGAIAGVLGAYLIWFPRRQVYVLLPFLFFVTARVSAVVLLGMWFLLQFLNGIAALSLGTAQAEGVAVWAHIGGFVAGVVTALWLRSRFRPQRHAFT
jgi:membrane associated rhomboid family serine protease